MREKLTVKEKVRMPTSTGLGLLKTQLPFAQTNNGFGGVRGQPRVDEEEGELGVLTSRGAELKVRAEGERGVSMCKRREAKTDAMLVK